MDSDIKLALVLILTPFLVIAMLLYIVSNPDGIDLVFYIFSGMLALLGIAVFCGKGMWAVAGFNTMSPKEHDEFNSKYDMKKVQRYIGIMFLIMGLSFMLLVTELNVYVTMILIVASIFIPVIIMNVFGDRLFKKTE